MVMHNESPFDFPSLSIAFERPYGALFLLFLPFVFWLYWRLFIHRKTTINLLFSFNSFTDVRHLRSTRLYFAKVVILNLCLALLIGCWMGPLGPPLPLQKEENKQERSSEKSSDHLLKELMILVDSSASMAVKDARVGVSRLDQSKELIELLIEEETGRQIALFAFTSELIPLSPPTFDHLFVLLQLRELTINPAESVGTDFIKLFNGLQMQAEGAWKKKQPIVLLFTDGEDNSEEAMTNQIKALVEKMNWLGERGWFFIVVGVGSHEGGIVPDLKYKGEKVISKLDKEFLSSLKTNFSVVLEADNLQPLIFAEEIKKIIKQHELTTNSSVESEANKPRQQHVVYEQLFWRPLFIAWLLLSLFLLCPERRLFFRG